MALLQHFTQQRELLYSMSLDAARSTLSVRRRLFAGIQSFVSEYSRDDFIDNFLAIDDDLSDSDKEVARQQALDLLEGLDSFVQSGEDEVAAHGTADSETRLDSLYARVVGGSQATSPAVGTFPSSSQSFFDSSPTFVRYLPAFVFGVFMTRHFLFHLGSRGCYDTVVSLRGSWIVYSSCREEEEGRFSQICLFS